jgi:carboxyl-terminal processing protease
VAILVDGYSASASEIFAACLQDHQRAEIVGQRTWGKGTVQTVIEIEPHRSAMRLTTATYWRPSGKNIHRDRTDDEHDEWGVKPRREYDVPLTTEQYRELFEIRRRRDVVQSTETSTDLPTATDPQLQRAVEYALSKMENR